eukprot:476486_1
MANIRTTDSKQNDEESKEEKKQNNNVTETVDFISKIFCSSSLNGPLTSIGKHAMNWLVWNTNNDIYWNFDLSQKKKKYIAFTMDDSPGIGLKGTIELLDFLKPLNIQITFFLISSMIRNPISKKINAEAAKVINRMLLDGHELGNHAVYDEKLINMEENEYYNKIKECEDTICEFDKNYKKNNKIKWYRPPSGLMTSLHYNVLNKFGYKIAMANKYGRDTRNCKNTNYLVNFYTNDINAGDIIIIHTPDELREDRYELLEAIKIIIMKLHNAGMLLTTLSNVYNYSM